MNLVKLQDKKLLAFLYTNNDKSENRIKETILFTTASKNNKIPRNKPT